jgi:hypothetical protein
LAEEAAHIAMADLDQTAAQQGGDGLAHRDHRDWLPGWM